jgi:integrase
MAHATMLRSVPDVGSGMPTVSRPQSFASPFDEIPLPPRIEELPIQLTASQIARLITTSLDKNPSPKAERDAALCALLAFEGLKATELTRLKWSDFFATDLVPTLRIDPSSTQRSPRLLILQAQTARYLTRYFHALREWEHPFWHSPKNKNMMFIGFKGRHHLTPLPHLTRHGLKFMLYELGSKIFLPYLTTEHLRHYAINFLLAQGLSSEQVMAHLGLRRLGNIAKYL